MTFDWLLDQKQKQNKKQLEDTFWGQLENIEYWTVY